MQTVHRVATRIAHDFTWGPHLGRRQMPEWIGRLAWWVYDYTGPRARKEARNG